MESVIKWTGSKRILSKEIIKYFPDFMNTYYEPFCGSASILFSMIENSKKAKKYICSDLNPDLINLWNMIIVNPNKIIERYYYLWNKLNENSDLNKKKNFFYKIRSEYNEKRKPEDFMFIMRTTTNGMPRYNKDGNFNNSFHVTRNGIKPKSLERIIIKAHNILNRENVSFINTSFENINSEENDLLFVDPPYYNTKGIYYGVIDYKQLWKWLNKQKGNYFLTFDGKTTNSDNTYKVPKYIYDRHVYLSEKNSSFRRIIGKSNFEYVQESLYIKENTTLQKKFSLFFDDA